MKRALRALVLVGATTALASGASVAASSAATATSIPVAGVAVGPQASWVTGVDDRGDVVGQYDTATETRGYLWHAGVFTDLGVLNGGDYTQVSAVNRGGAVVGASGVSAGTGGMHAFLWRNGRMTDLGAPSGDDSYANAVNGEGEVAGILVTPSETAAAFLWQDGKTTVLPGLGGSSSDPTAISAAGLVVGNAGDAAGYEHAVLWRNGKILDLGPGYAVAVNDAGQVLVQAGPAGSPKSAFVWSNGRETFLPDGVTAVGMNNTGQVVGFYTPSGAGTVNGFSWQQGTMTELGADIPTAVNDFGQILAYMPDGGNYDSVVLDRGETFTLTPTSGAYSSPSVISNSGLVGGASTTPNSATAWQLPVR